jgi:osmotically-inducible protein OsmY
MKPDRQLEQDVEEELEFDPAINAARIGIEGHERIVTEAGHLSSNAEKIRAERVAPGVAGVKAVEMGLEVRLAHTDRRTAEEIAAAVRSVLLWTVGLSEDAVEVEKGCVKLSDTANWGYQKQMAEMAVSQLRGAIVVVNNIDLAVAVAPPDVVEKIGDALKRYAEREARHIQVSVTDGTVTLSGTVGSLSEKVVSRDAAWSAPGVLI